MSKEVSATLHTDGGGVFGDLTVTGFATERTAHEVAGQFAEVLRRRWPEANVTVEVKAAIAGAQR